MLLRYFLLIVLSIPVVANSDTEPKNFNLGIGVYSLQLYEKTSEETNLYDSDRLNGVSLSAAYMLTNRIAFRGTYYSLDRGNFPDTEASGYDVLAYYGNGMAMRGFKWYIGGGYFSEEWDVMTVSYSFSGMQFSGGFGYNWQRYSFDMLLHARDKGDYNNNLSEPDSEIRTAGVLSMMMSARF
jgi:hypothetical protein